MKVRKLLLCYVASCLMLFVQIGFVYGGSAAGTMHISVRVLPVLDYRVLNSQRSFEVTQSDLENGYKDIAGGTVISVSTNSSDGYMLSVCGQKHESFDAVEVSVDVDTIELPVYGCTEIYNSVQGQVHDIKTLSYRVYLSSETEAGNYPLPVSVSALPL